jgi:hypothetical protein
MVLNEVKLNKDVFYHLSDLIENKITLVHGLLILQVCLELQHLSMFSPSWRPF